MENLVYGVFDSRERAIAAVEDLMRHGMPPDVMSVTMHEEDLYAEDVASPGTETRRFAITGGLVTGVVSGAFSGTVMTSLGMGPSVSITAAVFLGLGGMVLGAVGAGIVGSTEAKPELVLLRYELQHGHPLVTVDVEGKRHGLDVEEFLLTHGARHVGMI